jgi:hypothetical protein
MIRNRNQDGVDQPALSGVGKVSLQQQADDIAEAPLLHEGRHRLASDAQLLAVSLGDGGPPGRD